MSVIPDPATLAAYLAACVVLFVTPGPDMSLWLSRTVARGRRAGLATLAGTTLGATTHTMLAAFGISALIAASPTGFLILKLAGAGYLAWLAVDAVRRGSALSVAATPTAAGSAWRDVAVGLTVNLSNPKVILFFITFLPQFVAADDPRAAERLVFLGLLLTTLNVPCAAALILGADRLVGWLQARPRVLRAVDYLFAAVFAAFAIKIALTEGT